MLYKLTLPADFFHEHLTSELLVGIVRDLRPLGVELHFDLAGLELHVTKESGDLSYSEVADILGKIKIEFDKHKP